jgi:hypothetical protein
MRISDINFRAAWMLKTLETNLLGMFRKEEFVDGISPIECTKRVWVGSRFFQESLWPLRPVIELLRSALLLYGMLRRLGKQYSDHSIECLQLIGYCPATVVSEDEYGFQTSRTVHSIQRLL